MWSCLQQHGAPQSRVSSDLRSSVICRMPFEERAQLAQNACGKRLFELMARKRSNLAVAADVGTVQEVLRIAEAAGPHIAVLKTHVDIFDEWNSGIAAHLRKLAEEHGELQSAGIIPPLHVC